MNLAACQRALKTSYFENGIAHGAAKAAMVRDEPTFRTSFILPSYTTVAERASCHENA
jgi:hypothetical protein